MPPNCQKITLHLVSGSTISFYTKLEKKDEWKTKLSEWFEQDNSKPITILQMSVEYIGDTNLYRYNEGQVHPKHVVFWVMKPQGLPPEKEKFIVN